MWRNTQAGYGLAAQVLHWLIALLFACQLALGYLTQASADDPALQFRLYQWHKSLGFLILALALLRLGWWAIGIRPAPAGHMGRLERLAAYAAHSLLLGLTIVVPLAGWAVVSASPLAIPSYAFDLVVIPNLPLAASDAAEAFWSRVHALLAYGTGLLALGHALAALHHHFLRRDDTLRRMVRPFRKHAGWK
ncbi:cytochrome b [Aquamicrobium terrae]|uniref:Cytochrome b561 n=1 Tax=Aquamicrobium terrae TaxID=1324945 RepID=A0ABV2N5U0_9HYPH